MKALIYLALIFKENDAGWLPEEISSFLTGERKVIKNDSIFMRSCEEEFEYDDLGEYLFHYVSQMLIPNFRNFDCEHTAYIQVVPATDGDPLRVYLETGLLKILGEKGLGLDIHAQ